MSRAFVKEQDGEGPDELPDLPQSPHPNLVTRSGLAQLHQRLAQAEAGLAAIDADAVGGRLARAHLAREVRWLQARIAGARLCQAPEHPVRVEFGVTVEFVDETGHHYRYRIVGEDEADPEHATISWVSPLARALHHAQVGDELIWPRPSGDLRITILTLS